MNAPRRFLAATAVAAAALVPVSAAGAAPAEEQVVLVKVAGDATPAQLREVRADLGAVAVTPLAAGWRAYRLDDPVTLAEARALLADTTVDRAVGLDAVVTADAAAPPPTDPAFTTQWALQNTGQLIGQIGVAGADVSALAAWGAAPALAPVTVAVSDQGVDFTSPDLAGVAWSNPDAAYAGTHGWDFLTNTPVTTLPDPHATHVAGIIAAQANNGFGIAGVAPNARIMSVRFLDPVSGSGSLSAGIQSILWARDHGARVINASWGSASYSAALCDAIQTVVNSGVLVVAAASNDGMNNDVTPHYPASCPSPGLISVAASDNRDQRPGFSNWGFTSVDLAAPGLQIRSDYPGGLTAYMSGTSMAAPQVSGAAALLLGARPAATTAAVKSAILGGTTQVASWRMLTVTGGRLNLASSLAIITTATPVPAPAPDTTPPSAPVLRDPSGAGITATRTPTFSWGAAVDAESGISVYDLWIDGTVAQAGLTASQLSLVSPRSLADGAHTWMVVARNGAGLTTASATGTFTVLATAPVVPALLSPADGVALAPGTPITLRWSTVAATSYLVVVDGRVVGAGAGSFTLASLPLGTHSWNVVATGASGLRAVSAVRTIRIVGAPPVPILTSPANGLAIVATGQVTFRWIGIAGSAYTVTLDGRAPVAVPTNSYTVPSLAEGAHTWSVTATSGSGLRATSATWRLTVVRRPTVAARAAAVKAAAAKVAARSVGRTVVSH